MRTGGAAPYGAADVAILMQVINRWINHTWERSSCWKASAQQSLHLPVAKQDTALIKEIKGGPRQGFSCFGH